MSIRGLFMKLNGLKLFTIRMIVLLSCVTLYFGFSSPQIAKGIDWFEAGRDFFGETTKKQDKQLSGLSDSDIHAGLKDALRIGTERVIVRLGQINGFNGDPKIHIPLPENLQKVRSALGAIGMSGIMNDLELKLNRAAEQAAPQAKALFLESIENMTIDDVRQIYNGPQNAATQYFRGKMSSSLAEAMRPIISKSMSEVGAVSAYNAAIRQYRSIPFVPDVQADLTSYVVQKGMDGIFYYLEQEEAAIRQNPLKRTTEILQKVFGEQ